MKDFIEKYPEIAKIFYKHARNSGDYIPDYKYAEVAKDLTEFFDGERKSNSIDELVIPKVVEEKLLKNIVLIIREEFLLNTQNYPKEYHSMVDKKISSLIRKISEKYDSNFSGSRIEHKKLTKETKNKKSK